jgi:hypothetical protein
MALRVEGHTAVYCDKGSGMRTSPAPHDAAGVRLPADSGPGRGRCACGALSGDLPSGNARRRWHIRHKEEAAVVPWSDAAMTGANR